MVNIRLNKRDQLGAVEQVEKGSQEVHDNGSFDTAEISMLESTLGNVKESSDFDEETLEIYFDERSFMSEIS